MRERRKVRQRFPVVIAEERPNFFTANSRDTVSHSLILISFSLTYLTHLFFCKAHLKHTLAHPNPMAMHMLNATIEDDGTKPHRGRKVDLPQVGQ